MSQQTKVSIVINNHNYGRFLGEAIDSALSQTYPNTEVVVVDDGSTDDSREIISGYGDRIVPVLKENGGQASAFNAGFAASHGEWILLLDSDDVFIPSKAEEILKLAQENLAAGLIVHNLEYCDVAWKPIRFLSPTIHKSELVDDRKRVRRGTTTVYPPATSGLCFHREILDQILPMPESLRVTADNYLKTIALSLTPVLQIPTPLAKQRIHGENLYTEACRREASRSKVLRRCMIRAAVGFEIKKTHPCLSRLVWKQYGYILYQLSSDKSDEARDARTRVRRKYNVTEPSLVCVFCVASAFARALIGHHVRAHFYAPRAWFRNFAVTSHIPLIRTCDKAITTTVRALRRATG